jgi:hypothetical protein
MPVLILALLAGLAAFYFKGMPRPVDPAEPQVAAATPAPTTSPDAGAPDPPAAAENHAPAPATPPIVARNDLSESDFTPWMSSLALDTYLRQKNRGYQGSYWARGHWIRAIEGRWHEGAREFRIALGEMERPGEVQWHYRVDLTKIAFSEELARMSAKEFQLAQSQAYRHPDGSMRYQAVWQREGDAPVAKR